MATINVATKAYVDAVLDQSVVSGSINVSGHLILTKHDGSTFDAGDFDTAITALINTVLATANLLDILTSASAVDKVALRARGHSGQTADLQQWQNDAGSVLARVKADGKFDAVAIIDTEIDGALNTMTNINAAKIDSKKVTVNTTAPSTPAAGDIWINPSGA